MKKNSILETVAPVVSPEIWSQETEEGRDFVAELFFAADNGEIRTRGDLGRLLLSFGISSTGVYIAYFVGLLQGSGYSL